MRKRFTVSMLVLMLLCWLLSESGVAHAGNDKADFSLDYGNLTPNRTNPKSEQYGLLTGKYKPGSDGSFRPYLGVGPAYSIQRDDNPAASPKLRGGVGGQAGFSRLLGDKASLNVDYKVLQMAPDAAHRSGTTTPQTIGVGVEMKF